MALFDISRIENETVRELYRLALRRRDYIASSVKDAFGAQRAPIRTDVIDENAFNAYARHDEDAMSSNSQNRFRSCCWSCSKSS